MPEVQAVLGVVRNLWDTGNLYARWALATLAAWPAVVALVALLGSPALTSVVGLVPAAALVFVFCAYVDPLVVPVLTATTLGRTGLQWLWTILGLELGLGVYFAIVPVHNDPGLLPLFLLVSTAFGFFSMGTPTAATERVRVVLVAIAVVLTVIFAGGGREEVTRFLEEAGRVWSR